MNTNIHVYMKLHLSFVERIMLSLLFIFFVNQRSFADRLTEQNAVLKQYFNACMSQLHSPEVLKMADTLYQRANAEHNNYYQILARSVVLDYYYFKGDKDQVFRMVNVVKNISRQYNELDTYYFTWGSRLITFYLKNGMPSHALAEAQNMFREAQNDNYQPGIAECYKAMANIHLMQSNTEQAALNYKKLIDIMEQIEPDNVNLPVYYSSLIDNLMQSGQMKEAETALQNVQILLNKADTVTAYQKLCLAQSYLRFYLKKQDIIHAKKVFEQIENLFASANELSVFSIYLHDAQLRYYMGAKEYEKALAVIDSIWNCSPTFETKLMTLNRKGDIYWDMNNRIAAAECYRDYILANDSVRKRSMQNSADEVAGMLHLHQLEQEKQQLMIDMQNRRLTTTYWAIASLVIILVIVIAFMIHIYRLNRQLKESKQVVLRQNQELVQSSNELRIAKELAEEASRMKTHFIQNITHEVRTPLNAIVGFSQVLVEFYQKPETEEYASLITVNSNYLLRLFNDVLELSNIDQIDKLSYDTIADINMSCYDAINESKPFVKEGVELLFYPAEESKQIHTNNTYVKQILDNLLHNAAKFTTAGGITLEYTISPSEGVIRYFVTDTGIGIPLDQQETVFDRFKKLDYFAQGSGLGLSVARAIATKLGGTLCIDPEYTAGCRFVLTLPYIPV